MSKRKRLRLLVRNFHENGLKFVLENANNVRELLQLLNVKFLLRIDFAKMNVVSGHFVRRDYSHGAPLGRHIREGNRVAPATSSQGPRSRPERRRQDGFGGERVGGYGHLDDDRLAE